MAVDFMMIVCLQRCEHLEDGVFSRHGCLSSCQTQRLVRHYSRLI